MTNFAFIMDLLKIPSKKFLEIGFDKSLVSRWRRGKLRLMPNRYIVKSIAELFWKVDFERSQPILQQILTIWYPAEPCTTKAQKQELLERFLTEKGQLDEAYQQRREKRLGKLSDDSGSEQVVASKGIESAKLRMFDFLDLVAESPNPTQIDAAYPQGRGLLAFDTDFNAQTLEKYTKLFDMGHKMNAIIRTDDAITSFAYSYHHTLAHLLKGYVRNQYFDDFSTDTKELFLAVAGDLIAIELLEEIPGRIESTISMIYTDKENIERIRSRIHVYAKHSKKREYFGFFDAPDHYLSYVHISPDSPCYMFTSLPHFEILPAEEFSNSFSLTKAESEFVSQEIKPLTLNPEFFWEYATVRHIFCESAIEHALLKKRHQCLELSKLLGRRVWMSTPQFIRQLVTIQSLSKTHKNYEVCFLNEERFEQLQVQLAVWGYGASIVWIDDAHIAASRGYTNQRVIQGFCHAAWDSIPTKIRSRTSAIHKIEQWLEKARRYGYEVE